MLSRITLVYLFLLAMLAGCASSEKTHSNKDASAGGVNENAVSEEAGSEEESSTRSQREKHMLWQVSDSNSSVYLLGSVHFADPTFYPLDTAITNAFDRSDELAVELDMSDTAVFMEIAKQSELRGKLPAGQSLAQVLPKDVKKQLDSVCASWSLAPEVLYGFKPWSAAMTLSSVAIMRLGFDPNLGIDFYFLRSAQESKKKVVSLESAEDQIAVLVGEGLPDSLGIYYLKSTLNQMQLMDSSVTLMMEAWVKGNDSLFREAMYMEPEGSATDSLLEAQIEELVYIARNRTMADSVASFLAQDRKVFVVVGAAHMAGKGDNVLKLLRDKGYTVEQK
ncbi:MAG: TraB/GumN family protein [Fibrobacter sp.]|nr:TraB/GumN family protein [Fibrobacter sp.]